MLITSQDKSKGLSPTAWEANHSNTYVWQESTELCQDTIKCVLIELTDEGTGVVVPDMGSREELEDRDVLCVSARGNGLVVSGLEGDGSLWVECRVPVFANITDITVVPRSTELRQSLPLEGSTHHLVSTLSTQAALVAISTDDGRVTLYSVDRSETGDYEIQCLPICSVNLLHISLDPKQKREKQGIHRVIADPSGQVLVAASFSHYLYVIPMNINPARHQVAIETDIEQRELFTGTRTGLMSFGAVVMSELAGSVVDLDFLVPEKARQGWGLSRKAAATAKSIFLDVILSQEGSRVQFLYELALANGRLKCRLPLPSQEFQRQASFPLFPSPPTTLPGHPSHMRGCGPLQVLGVPGLPGYVLTISDTSMITISVVKALALRFKTLRSCSLRALAKRAEASTMEVDSIGIDDTTTTTTTTRVASSAKGKGRVTDRTAQEHAIAAEKREREEREREARDRERGQEDCVLVTATVWATSVPTEVVNRADRQTCPAGSQCDGHMVCRQLYLACEERGQSYITLVTIWACSAGNKAFLQVQHLTEGDNGSMLSLSLSPFGLVHFPGGQLYTTPWTPTLFNIDATSGQATELWRQPSPSGPVWEVARTPLRSTTTTTSTNASTNASIQPYHPFYIGVGIGREGCVRKMEYGYNVQRLLVTKMEGANRVWTLGQSNDGSSSSLEIMVLSFANATRVLSIGSEMSDITQSCGFNANEATLLAHAIPNSAWYVQITPTGIVVTGAASADTYAPISWTPPDGDRISCASAWGYTLVLSCAQASTLLVLVYQPTSASFTSTTLTTNHSFSCTHLSPSYLLSANMQGESDILIFAGTYSGDVVVYRYSASSSSLQEVSTLAMSNGSIPESMYFHRYHDGEKGERDSSIAIGQLLVGTRDGLIKSYLCSRNGFQFWGEKRLGVTQVDLVVYQNLPANASTPTQDPTRPDLVALCQKPYFVYGLNTRPNTNVTTTTTTTAAGAAAAAATDVGTSGPVTMSLNDDSSTPSKKRKMDSSPGGDRDLNAGDIQSPLTSWPSVFIPVSVPNVTHAAPFYSEDNGSGLALVGNDSLQVVLPSWQSAELASTDFLVRKTPRFLHVVPGSPDVIAVAVREEQINGQDFASDDLRLQQFPCREIVLLDVTSSSIISRTTIPDCQAITAFAIFPTAEVHGPIAGALAVAFLSSTGSHVVGVFTRSGNHWNTTMQAVEESDDGTGDGQGTGSDNETDNTIPELMRPQKAPANVLYRSIMKERVVALAPWVIHPDPQRTSVLDTVTPHLVVTSGRSVHVCAVIRGRCPITTTPATPTTPTTTATTTTLTTAAATTSAIDSPRVTSGRDRTQGVIDSSAHALHITTYTCRDTVTAVFAHRHVLICCDMLDGVSVLGYDEWDPKGDEPYANLKLIRSDRAPGATIALLPIALDIDKGIHTLTLTRSGVVNIASNTSYGSYGSQSTTDTPTQSLGRNTVETGGVGVGLANVQPHGVAVGGAQSMAVAVGLQGQVTRVVELTGDKYRFVHMLLTDIIEVLLGASEYRSRCAPLNNRLLDGDVAKFILASPHLHTRIAEEYHRCAPKLAGEEPALSFEEALLVLQRLQGPYVPSTF